LPIDLNGPIAREFVPIADAALSDPISRIFSRVSAQHADRASVVDGHGTLSYRQIQLKVEEIATHLAAVTVPGRLVAILLPPSAGFVAAMLACLAAGRPFVPIDLHYPQQWIAQVLEDADSKTIITRASLPDAIALVPPGSSVIDLDAIPRGGGDAPLLEPATADSPALVLYTSGSTGRPKGIVNSQRAVLRRVQQYIAAAHIGPDDRFLPLSSECTIAGLRERLTALLSGATLYLTDLQRGGAGQIMKVLREAEITMIYAVPALLRTLAQLGDGKAPASLRVVRVGGDAVLWSDIGLLREWLPPSCLIELGYSSTEAPIMQWFVPPGFPVEGPRVPIGYPLAGNEIAIIGEDGRSVADGEVGELVLRSPYVALGRWRDGACAGDDYPADPVEPTKRIQYTGDLVRLRRDGLVDLIGRKDRQIKIRGQRIEPAEIEAVLRQWPGVRDAAVIVREGTAAEAEGTGAALAAYVEASLDPADGGLDEALRQHARGRLPPALQPQHLYLVDALPRLPSAKLDARALRAIDEANAARERSVGVDNLTRPQTATEQIVAEIWSTVLGRTETPRDANFFDLGGNSLAAVRLIYLLEQRLSISLPVTVIYQAPSIAELSALVAARAEIAFSPLVLVRAGGPAPPLFIIHGVGGNVMELFGFGRQIDYDGPVYGVQACGLDGRAAPLSRISDMSDYYRQAIREIQPSGPYCLSGYSYGGLIAFDLACRLAAQGEEIGLLALIDSTTNPRRWPYRVWLTHLMQRARDKLPEVLWALVRRRLVELWASLRAGSKRVAWRLGLGESEDRRLAIEGLPPVLQAVRNGCIKAALDYFPGYYEGHLTLIIAEVVEPHSCDPRWIWKGHAARTEVYVVAGDHSTMIEGENGKSLAAILSTVLAKARARR
jgi:amino acid adenylation domain-containing protein